MTSTPILALISAAVRLERSGGPVQHLPLGLHEQRAIEAAQVDLHIAGTVAGDRVQRRADVRVQFHR
jgi:hypothetical protein